jgi:hypothetical protein
MRITSRTAVTTVASALGGAVVGFLLEAPLFTTHVEPLLSPFAPQLQRLDAYLQAHGAWYASNAFVAFLLHLPKTVLLAAMAAIAMLALPIARRAAFYAVFLAPLLAHGFYWFQVWRLKQGAARLGLPTPIDGLPTEPRIGVTVIFVLLTYGLFAVLVFVILQARGKSSAPHA